MSEFELRPAVPDDLAALCRLEMESFDDAWSAPSLQAALEDPRYVVLVSGPLGRPGGYILGWTVSDEGEIARLAVTPSQRRRGLGRALLEACRVEMLKRGAVAIYLDVRATNAAAQALYLDHGFEVVARRRNYYPNGDDAVLMRWAE